MKKNTAFLMSALGLLALSQAPVFAQAQANPQSIIVNPAPTDLTVRVGVDRIGENPVYRIGDSIRLSVSVNQDAYVYLFSVHANGEVDLVMPNRLSGGNAFMKAGETRQFPPQGASYTFRVDGPTGQDKVLAVAAKRPLNLDEIAKFNSGAFASVSVSSQGSLAKALSIVVEPLPQQDWVTGIAYFQVGQAVAAAPVQPSTPVVVVQPQPVPQPAPVVVVQPQPAPQPVQQQPRSIDSRYGINLMPGATVIQLEVYDNGFALRLQTNANMQAVARYYEDALNRNGWFVTMREDRGNKFKLEMQNNAGRRLRLALKAQQNALTMWLEVR